MFKPLSLASLKYIDHFDYINDFNKMSYNPFVQTE